MSVGTHWINFLMSMPASLHSWDTYLHEAKISILVVQLWNVGAAQCVDKVICTCTIAVACFVSHSLSFFSSFYNSSIALNNFPFWMVFSIYLMTELCTLVLTYVVWLPILFCNTEYLLINILLNVEYHYHKFTIYYSPNFFHSFH